jgi:hypothetical protein
MFIAPWELQYSTPYDACKLINIAHIPNHSLRLLRAVFKPHVAASTFHRGRSRFPLRVPYFAARYPVNSSRWESSP